MTGSNLPTPDPPAGSAPAATANVKVAEDIERGQLRIIAGPFPGPGIMKGYQEVDRTFPDRLMRIAEAYAAQRLRTEDKRVDAEVYVEKQTPVLLAIIILGVLAVITFAIYRGMSGLAIAAMLSALGGVIGVAHLRRLMSRDKREDREYETPELSEPGGEHLEVDATGERRASQAEGSTSLRPK